MRILFLMILVVLIVVAIVQSPKKVSDADLLNVLYVYPELYVYSNGYINKRVDTPFKDHVEIEFAYGYTQTAKTHIAIIKGETVAVDNAFVNNCVDSIQLYHEDRSECRLITELGTIESVTSDHTRIVVDHFGVLSRDNLHKAILSKETFSFLSRIVSLFQADK